MAKSSSRSTNSGFTVVELMTTLTVALLLLVIGVPSVSTLLANNQMVATTNDLVTHLQYARSESVKRQMPVSVCSSGDGLICAGSSEWGVGWIVFTDDSGTAGSFDGSDQLLRSFQPTGSFVSIAANYNFVRYLTDGSISL